MGLGLSGYGLDGLGGAWLRVESVVHPGGGVEGIYSRQWSVGIFIFLIICIIVFTGIVLRFMLGEKARGMRTGEKVMFAWILLGVAAAVVLAVLQILQGHLL